MSQSAYYKGSDTFVALPELTCKRKHQYPHSNYKLGPLFYDDSDDGILDNVKRQLYPGEDHTGQGDIQGSNNENDTPN